jgi:hypothetical protein
VVAILTRATPRRIAGALAGGAASGVVALGLIALWERVGWWHMVMPGLFTWEPYFLTLMLIDATLWAFIFRLTKLQQTTGRASVFGVQSTPSPRRR